MRILIAVPHFSTLIGRAESGLANHLVNQGHQVKVVAGDLGTSAPAVPGGEASPSAPDVPPYLELHPGLRLGSLFVPRALEQTFRAWRPDVIHFCEAAEPLSIRGARAAARLGIPWVVVSERYQAPPAVRGIAYRVLLRGAAKAIRDSRLFLIRGSAHERYWNVRGVPPAKMRRVPTGIDASEIEARSRQTPPPLWDSAFDGASMVSVGRLVANKNFVRLLRALSVLRSPTKWRLLVVGRGPEGARIRREIHRLGLRDRVTLHEEFVEHRDIPALLASAHLYLQPSAVEPFGITVIEAMSAGTPVVAARVGGMVDTVTEAVGWTCDPFSVESIARAIDQGLEGRAALRREDIRAYARRGYDWAVVGSMYERAYDEALQSTPRNERP